MTIGNPAMQAQVQKLIRRACMPAIAIVLFLVGISSSSCGPLRDTRDSPSPTGGVPRFLFNMYGKGKDDRLKEPQGVVAKKGKVYVTDTKNGRVCIFTSQGNLLQSFPIVASFEREAVGSLQKGAYPVGIAVDDSGILYVSDPNQGKILTFSANGHFLSNFPASEEERALLQKPLALSFSHQRLYLTDVGDQSVKVFSKSGNFLHKFGSRGKKENTFMYPNGIVVDSKGRTYVADSNNSRVQVLSAEGEAVFSIGKDTGEYLVLPRGVALDDLGRIHVVDTFAHTVFVFGQDGKFLLSYGSDSEEFSEASLSYPNGIAIDQENKRVYIADKGNSRISVWEY